MNACLIQEPGKMVYVEDFQIPTPEPHEVLIKVMAAGICGTDIHLYKGDYFGSYPLVPGHEFSGIIEAVGEKVTRFKAGQRVTADPNIFCEACDSCKKNLQNFCENTDVAGITRHGAFAQYLTISERCVFDIGDMSFTEAALAEPLSCVVHGQNTARVPLGGRVLIFGAGPIGLMHCQVAAMNGASCVTVIDTVPEKLEVARKMGAQFALTADEFARTGKEGSYELVIDCTGIPAVVENAVKYLRDLGTLLIFGVTPIDSKISVSPYDIYRRELKLVGSYALRKTLGAAIDLIHSKRLNLLPLVDRKLQLSDSPEVFAQMVKGNSGFKAMAYPHGIPAGEQ